MDFCIIDKFNNINDSTVNLLQQPWIIRDNNINKIIKEPTIIDTIIELFSKIFNLFVCGYLKKMFNNIGFLMTFDCEPHCIIYEYGLELN